MGRNDTPKANAVAANSPSLSARESRVNAARVKTEKGENAVRADSKLVVETLKGDAPPRGVPSSHAIDHEEEVLFFNTYDETAKYGSEIYSCSLKTKIWKNITVREL